jgi:pimeloyl-ACP methyl ester carboxylesterase
MIGMSATIVPSRSERIELRGIATSLRRWGPADAPILLMVHGIRDCAATFQFVVDALRGGWQVVSPDWRGHGHSERVAAYWFHDFVADLSTLVDLLSPDAPLPIVGHSLGGNIAGIFAGLRPQRVSHLISLDGFGPLINAVPVDVPTLMRDFLDGPATPRPRSYPDVASMAVRLRQSNPRLTEARAIFLAEHSSAPLPTGGRRWLFSPDIRQSLPSFRTLEEWKSIWAQITAPTLWIQSEDKRPKAPAANPAEMVRRMAMMPAVERVQLESTGHNLQHDAPEVVATLISDFLDRTAAVPAAPIFSAKGG